MKFLLLFSFTFALSGCALKSPSPGDPVVISKTAPIKENKVIQSEDKGSVWEILNKEKLGLQFKNLDNGTNVTVLAGKGISIHSLPPGDWELTGYEEGGRSFSSMNTSKKFVLHTSSKFMTYAGSLVIGCPRIQANDYKYLKTMKFFNRYPFSGKQGLCEMVIGNDFASVKSRLKNAHKSKKLNVVMGF